MEDDCQDLQEEDIDPATVITVNLEEDEEENDENMEDVERIQQEKDTSDEEVEIMIYLSEAAVGLHSMGFEDEI